MEYQKEVLKTTEKQAFIKADIKTSNFKKISEIFFNKLMTFFKKNFEANELAENVSEVIENPEMNQISKEFDRYIDNDIWKFALELIENGYEPSKKQYKNLYTLLNNKFKNNSALIFELNKSMSSIPLDILVILIEANPSTLFDLMRIKDEVPEQIALQAIKNVCLKTEKLEYSHEQKIKLLIKRHINSENAIDIFDIANNHIRKTAKHLCDNLSLTHNNIGCIGNANETQVRNLSAQVYNSNNIIRLLVEFLPIDALESYKKHINEIKEAFIHQASKFAARYEGKYFKENCENLNIGIYNESNVFITQLIQQKLVESKDEIIRKVKNLNSGKLLDKKINESISHSKLSISNELSKQAQDLVSNINKKYDNIISKTNDSEEISEIKSLYENRLPQIVKKYLLIDVDYRKELKNIQGKNAEELMLESLSNIEEVLDNKIKQINENRLSDLSVAQRYTKEIKHKM